MPSLYQIKQELIDCTDTETGEIIDVARFEELQIEADEKIENVALWYKNLLADAASYKVEKEHFAQREKIAKNKAESLKKYLDDALGGKVFKTVKVDITYRKSTSVNITDDTLLPESLVTEVVTTSPDKKAIAELLKAGEKVPGAELSTNQNIQIK